MMNRKAKIERRRATGEALEREPFEGARAFGVSLSRRLCFPPGHSLPMPSRSTRALAFARKIAARHAQQPGARSLDFLRSYFGGKYGVVEGQGLTGTRIYKKPGGTILESSNKLSLNFTLLLKLRRLSETLNLRLVQKNLTLLQSLAQLASLPVKDASLRRMPSEGVRLTKLLSVHRQAQAPTSAPVLVSMLRLTSMPVLAPAPVPARWESIRFVQRDSYARREVKESVRAMESPRRVSGLFAAQGTTRAGIGDARTLYPAATRGHHFNFTLFPQCFNPSFRQTSLYQQSYFGGKYGVVEGQGLTNAGTQSNPGVRIQERLQESSNKLSLNFTLLLKLRRLSETLNLRLVQKNLTLLQSLAQLASLPVKDASLIKLLSARTHAQAPASAQVLIPHSTMFVQRDSYTQREVKESVRATESPMRVSSLFAAQEASVFINRVNAQAGLIADSSAEAERNDFTTLHSMATLVSYISSAFSWQSLICAPEREIVYSNFARTHLQHHFRQGENLRTALALDAQSRAAGRLLIRQQNFLRSFHYDRLAPLTQVAPLAHDFKQTPGALFISESYAMGLTGAQSQPPVTRGAASIRLPLRPASTSLTAHGALQREILQRRESLRQSGFARARSMTDRNSSVFVPLTVKRPARLTIAHQLMPAGLGLSFSWPAVHEKLVREGLMLEAYALETLMPEKLSVKVRPLSSAGQFVTNGMRNMVTVKTRGRAAGLGMVSAHTGAAVYAGAIVNARLRPTAAASRKPVPSALNLAKGIMSVSGVGPIPSLLSAPLGKVDTLHLPPLGYVYAQPLRSTLEEQRVITQIDHKEVSQIVQREVQGAMARDTDVTRFSRADYAQIADQVYSTLVRRLVVEKERLGLC